jgi:hypothetical protein
MPVTPHRTFAAWFAYPVDVLPPFTECIVDGGTDSFSFMNLGEGDIDAKPTSDAWTTEGWTERHSFPLQASEIDCWPSPMLCTNFFGVGFADNLSSVSVEVLDVPSDTFTSTGNQQIENPANTDGFEGTGRCDSIQPNGWYEDLSDASTTTEKTTEFTFPVGDGDELGDDAGIFGFDDNDLFFFPGLPIGGYESFDGLTTGAWASGDNPHESSGGEPYNSNTVLGAGYFSAGFNVFEL